METFHKVMIAMAVLFVAVIAGWLIARAVRRSRQAGGSGQAWTLYYMPGCGWCQKIKPHFQQICDSNRLQCNMVNVSDDYEKFAHMQGFPTIVGSRGTQIKGYHEYGSLRKMMGC